MAKRSAKKYRGGWVVPVCLFLLLGCGSNLGCGGNEVIAASVDTGDQGAALAEVVEDGDAGDDDAGDDNGAASGGAADSGGAAEAQVLSEAFSQVVVRPGNTLSGIVGAECGGPVDLDLVHQVFLDNEGVPQEVSSDALGDRLQSPNGIEIGWVLLIDCTLRDDSPNRRPLGCLDGDERAFGGRTDWTDNGNFFNVTICVADDGRAEYFGVDQRDESIRLPACLDDNGAFRAENQGWTYELAVDPNGERASLVLTDDTGAQRLGLAFVSLQSNPSVDVPRCTPPPAVYQVRPAAVSRMTMRSNPPTGFPADAPPDASCLELSIEAAIITGPPTRLEPGAPAFVEQGRWLRFGLSPGATNVALVGGGLSLSVAPSFTVNGVQEFSLKVTDLHPPGIYEIQIGGVASGLPPVIIEPPRTLSGGFASRVDGETTFLFYGLSADDEVTVFHEVALGCGEEWQVWSDGGSIEANDDGNGRLVIDTSAGHVGLYCLVINEAEADFACLGAGVFSVR